MTLEEMQAEIIARDAIYDKALVTLTEAAMALSAAQTAKDEIADIHTDRLNKISHT